MADIRLEQLLHTAADNPIGTTNGALDVHVTASSGLATQATLAAVLTALDSKATAAKQDAAKAVLDTIAASAATAAKEATLTAIRTALTDGTQKVQLSGTDVVIGLLTDRPPASEMRGRGYYAWDETDGHKLKYSDGTNWVVNQ